MKRRLKDIYKKRHIKDIYLKDIQKLINISIPVIDNHDYPMEDFEIKPKEQPRGRAPRNDKPRSSSSQAKPSNGSSKRYGNR